MADFVTETFTGADGTTLATHNAQWVARDSVLQQIAAGRLRISGSGNANYAHAATAPGNDFDVSADVYCASAVANYFLGLGARHDGGTNYYHGRYDSTGTVWQLIKVVSGVFTTLGTSAVQTLVAGQSYPLKLRVQGSTISLFKQNEATPILSVTDTALATGRSGLRTRLSTGTPSDTTGFHLDNFIAGDIASSSAAVTTSGIASAESFGSASVTARRAIAATGIASAQAFGSSTLSRIAVAAIQASGIASGEQFGTASVARLSVAAITAAGSASQEAFGVATLSRSSAAAVSASGIASSESFGTAGVSTSAGVSVSTVGIASAESFGSATVSRTSVASVSATGIASAQAFGTVAISSAAKVTAFGIASQEAFGTATFARISVAQVATAGIASAESFGSAAIGRSGPVQIVCPGILSAEAFGVARMGDTDATVGGKRLTYADLELDDEEREIVRRNNQIIQLVAAIVTTGALQ
ncbi:MAG: hypothetical protein H0W48_00370 [Methylibium sp.]|nr:hypothetical protein [Methylibium sp.]